MADSTCAYAYLHLSHLSISLPLSTPTYCHYLGGLREGPARARDDHMVGDDVAFVSSVNCAASDYPSLKRTLHQHTPHAHEVKRHNAYYRCASNRNKCKISRKRQYTGWCRELFVPYRYAYLPCFER